MSEQFQPVKNPVNQSVKPNYQLTKLYGEAFPVLSHAVLFRIEGAKDLVKSEATKMLGMGYKVKPDKSAPVKIDYTGIQTIEVDEGDATSYLGTPIFFQVKFGKGTYNVLDNGKVKEKSFANDFTLPATSTVEINRAKKRTDTEINGQAGTVKELWGFSDWNITIRGLVLTEGKQYEGRNSSVFPSKELNDLAKWEEIADSIEVSGVLFDIFKIKRICINNLQIGQVVGSPNAIPFIMTCSSDEAAEFSIVNNVIQQ